MQQHEEEACDRLTTMIATEPQRLQNRIGRLIYDDRAAEDLAQESLVRAVRNIAKLRGPADQGLLCQWLDRIACNVAFNYTRDQQRKPTVVPFENDDAPVNGLDQPQAANPEAIVSQREAQLALAGLIRALPPEIRDVLILRDVDGLSTSETAVKLGIKEGLVKWRLSRARSLLRTQLTDMVGSG